MTARQDLIAHANVPLVADIAAGFAITASWRARLQVRLYPGAPGAAWIDLPPVQSAREGVQAIAGSNVFRARAEEATLQAVYATLRGDPTIVPLPEAGKPVNLAYDIVAAPLGGDEILIAEGGFQIFPGVTRSWRTAGGVPRVGVVGDSIMVANHIDNGNGTLSLGWAGELAWAQARDPSFAIASWYDAAEDTHIAGLNRAHGAFYAGPGNDSVNEIGARMTALIAQSPDVIAVGIGTNNLRSIGGTTTGAYVAPLIIANAQQALDAGIPVILFTVRPQRQAYWDAHPSVKTETIACNALLRTWAAGRAGVTLADAWAWYDNGTGAANDADLYDDVHPQQNGAFKRASFPLAQLLKDVLRSTGDARPQGANRVTNPTLLNLGTAGTNGARVTGTVATNRFANGLSSGMAVVASLIAGGGQKLVVTGGGAAAEYFTYDYNAGGPPLVPGEWVQAAVTVELDTWAGWKGVYLGMAPLGGVFTTPHANDFMNLGTTTRLTLITPPQLVPAGTGVCAFTTTFALDGTVTGSGTANILEMRLAQVADPRV